MVSVLVFEQPLSTGRKVRILRVAHGMRQVDLASAARCTPADVSDLERDLHISKTARSRILKVLGIEDEAEPS